MLQETRVRRLNLAKAVGNVCSLKAQPKNSTRGFLSGGLATIATNKQIMKKDQRNTSEFILATDLMLNNKDDPTNCHQGDHVKLINVYFQPNKKQEIRERLLDTIHKIMKAEPGVLIVLGGDFNTPLEDPKNLLRKELE